MTTATAPSKNSRAGRGRGGARWLTLAAGVALSLCATANDAPAGAHSAAIDKVFADFVHAGEPGCSVGVMRNGALVHTSAYGLADVAERKAIDPNSIFNIASISKQFTAFSILLLDERKALSIDDPLIKHVPELSASARGVTLRHLLHHTGGLRDYEILLRLLGRRYSDGATQFETIQALGRQRAANTPPNTVWAYSNSGYVLLATVVERVSKRSMKQFAAENIFEPVGMRQTTIVDRYPAGLPKLARGYSPNEKKTGFDIEESAWEQVGDGQVHTTAADLLLWAENLLTGRVGGQQLMKRMVEVGTLDSGERHDYAAGLGIAEHNGLPTVSHGGGWAGYRSQFLVFPQQHFAVSVFCNRGDANPSKLAKSVADIFLADEIRRVGKKSPPQEDPQMPAPPAAQWQPAKLSDYEGVYWSDEAEARCLLVQRSGQLVVEGCMPGYKLQPADDRQFYVQDIYGRLIFPSQPGQASGFTLQTHGLNALAFKRQ
jgi:CubicO group peptidase (beta-lactamase class C family)